MNSSVALARISIVKLRCESLHLRGKVACIVTNKLPRPLRKASEMIAPAGISSEYLPIAVRSAISRPIGRRSFTRDWYALRPSCIAVWPIRAWVSRDIRLRNTPYDILAAHWFRLRGARSRKPLCNFIPQETFQSALAPLHCFTDIGRMRIRVILRDNSTSTGEKLACQSGLALLVRGANALSSPEPSSS